MQQKNPALDKITRIQRITSIGRIVLTACEGAVVSIGMAKEGDPAFPETSSEEPVLARAAEELTEYLAGRRTVFSFPMRPEGTPFQKKVWNALLNIPFGGTKSYGEIAAEVDNPRGSRAVGMACNRNPIMIAVPCHRVVGANGSLTGYALGMDLKKRLLRMERDAK